MIQQFLDWIPWPVIYLFLITLLAGGVFWLLSANWLPWHRDAAGVHVFSLGLITKQTLAAAACWILFFLGFWYYFLRFPDELERTPFEWTTPHWSLVTKVGDTGFKLNKGVRKDIEDAAKAQQPPKSVDYSFEPKEIEYTIRRRKGPDSWWFDGMRFLEVEAAAIGTESCKMDGKPHTEEGVRVIFDQTRFDPYELRLFLRDSKFVTDTPATGVTPFKSSKAHGTYRKK